METFFKILILFSIIMFSAGYFLEIYQEIGVELSVKCFIIWGFSLASYAFILWVLNLIFNN